MKNLFTWLPRVIVLVFILFIASFALDAFDEDASFWGKIGDFAKHLIPAAVTSVFLFVAWRYRIFGGLLLMVLGMVFTIYFRTDRSLYYFMSISFPLLLGGLLFIFSKLSLERNSI